MIKKICYISCVLLLLAACTTRVSKGVLDKSTMEDLLYDYHLAQALAKGEGDSMNIKLHLYTEAVYDKYGVTEEQFNKSMEWYTRNSEQLFDIYKNIDARFAEVVGSGSKKENTFADMTAVGDTMNLWQGKNFYLLSASYRNCMHFEIPADTLYSKGDRLMWQFRMDWYYRESGQRSAYVTLAVVYDNDSVGTVSGTYSGIGKQEVTIRVANRPVKTVQGFIYLQDNWAEQPRLLTITEPVLVRFKKQKTSGEDTDANVQLRDTTRLIRMRDVINKENEVADETESTEEQPESSGRTLYLPR